MIFIIPAMTRAIAFDIEITPRIQFDRPFFSDLPALPGPVLEGFELNLARFCIHLPPAVRPLRDGL